MNSTATAYRALATGVALFDRTARGRLAVTGPDRARFLHNLTTNDVKRLAVDHGQEAFVTTLQGKTLGFVTLLACAEGILLRSDPGALETMGPHLRKYGVFDDVVLNERSEETFELHLAGPHGEELLLRLGGALPEPIELAHLASAIADTPVRVVRESPTGRPGLTLIGPIERLGPVRDRLHAAGRDLGLAEGDEAAYEAARIEAGSPRSGVEVTIDNLPQEVGRDARAINFVKGCYLGQETVARIDALGHVNRHLRGLKLRPGPVPAPGAPVEAGGKPVGVLTSAADSPGWGHPVALGYLRTSHAQAETEVEIRHGDMTLHATVAELPMLPPATAGGGTGS